MKYPLSMESIMTSTSVDWINISVWNSRKGYYVQQKQTTEEGCKVEKAKQNLCKKKVIHSFWICYFNAFRKVDIKIKMFCIIKF